MLVAALHFLASHSPHIASSLGLVHHQDPHGAPVETVKRLRDHDPHYGLNPATYALIFGIVSGLSLPLGAGAGIYLAPVRPHTCALMMAFGAGALLFAVTVELYGHALREVEEGRLGVLEMFTIIFGALVGAAFYLTTNQWLKDAFPEPADDDEESSPRKDSFPRHAASSPILDSEASPLLKREREVKKEHEAVVREREELRKEERESAPLMHALKHEMEHPTHQQKTKATAKAMWAKLRGEKRVALKLLSADAWSFERPREKAIKAACESADIDTKGLTVALGIFLGLLVDGVPEGILMGFLSAEGHLTPVLIVSLFIANLPESFASGSLMVQAGLSTFTIMSLWTGLCLLVGSLCGLSCYLLLFFFPDYGSSHSTPGHESLPQSVLIGISLVEGITGGAMIACISSVMLPEAFANCDKNLPFWNQTGFLCTTGFLVSVGLKTVFG